MSVSAFIVTVQSFVPLQPPPVQPAKYEPASGIADSVTTAPSVYVSVQSVPQSIPAGELVTVPEPLPALVIVKS
ncbi:MAG TPA: hypothetical protein ENH01_06535 [Nitrospirae bacterium]|nr:hypothetical protein [Nitrospirota bacterium]